MNKEDYGNTKIYMIGAIQERPVPERDPEKCCYKAFLHMDLKTVSEMINYIPSEERCELVNFCRNCSFQKLNDKGRIS